ncbi:AraC-type DNA-binding protein [Polaribacter sp. Hel1_33_78]|jgi:AraC-like DNA-binding protein|uniref:AraC family transcriptional regulator n=1 Tax=unclassified Polaribacter TaxID=196858 RepID=UPI00052CD83A|nr:MULTISPECIES: AraC family transcriptional regulator [unclassified Polaribacter]KGL61457.1 transcriptional regulator [Polaribacter sp. Hel1_33_49]MBT3741153.1 helix-turn-helix transcriptional regulator [Polaribacter sp.]MBT4413080.1 helix-turn-helix transcriptional regulator [Polaribacter sp.]MDG1196246.1 AraC family transcriptional regulator [Polaribacter sp.]MDG1402580.1 AraC family transcriptional regulator [Polaribacter sp.]
MKVFPFKIPKPANIGLIYQEDIEILFYDKLHQHDEIQISFIERGSGTLFIGDKICNYTQGSVFVIGSNIPHAFKSDKNVAQKSKMLSLFFTKSSFGETFFELDEFAEIDIFFEKSSRGFVLKSNIDAIIFIFLQMKKVSKIKRFMHFLEILQLLAISETTPLSSFVYQKIYSDMEGKRMRTIFEYTLENYHQKITLQEVANKANMTKNAFCKYFKNRTNKTYFNFLNEIRIENASKLIMIKKEISINEIAYITGFNNISNFNRKFKEIKKMTPLNFKKLQII